ncbi:hypothetical protein C0995_012192 [Termitomyces sp. Mi166|nr:hypothetical protein C0995_012192 [Termitomyces sp. Mi166\
MVEVAKAHLVARGLPTAYYQLERGKKVKASQQAAVSTIGSKKGSVVKSKEFMESEKEEEIWAREIKWIKREHKEKRKIERKEETVGKKPAIMRLQLTAGPSKPKATASTSVSKPTVVITKLPPIISKPKEKTLVKISRSEGEEGMKWRLRRR